MAVKKIITCITLFIILSCFTVYPSIDILKFRASTIIDTWTNNIEPITLKPNDYLTYSFFVEDNLSQIDIRATNPNTASQTLLIQITGNNSSFSTTKEIEYNNKKAVWISIDKISKNLIYKDKINISMINNGDKPIYLYISNNNIQGNYIKFNDQNINGLTPYIKIHYDKGQFFSLSIVLIILIIIIQIYITYLVILKKYEGNDLYYYTVILFLCMSIFRFPFYTISSEPFYETMSYYIQYNLNKSPLEQLFLYDYGLTILPSIINIIAYIIGLTKYLPMFLYITGIIIGCACMALFMKPNMKKYAPAYIRIVITLAFLNLLDGEVFYISSMFAYCGIFFIIYLFLCNLNNFSRITFTLSMVFVTLIILSKASYVILAPASLFILICLYKKLYTRMKIYLSVIICSNIFHIIIMKTIFSELVGNRTSKTFSENTIETLVNVIIKDFLNIIMSASGLYKITVPYTSIIAVCILTATTIYILYSLKRKSNICISIYITSIFIAIFSQCAILYATSTKKIVEPVWNNFIFIPHYRHYFFSYIFIFMLIVILIYLIKNQYNGNKYSKYIFMFAALSLFTLSVYNSQSIVENYSSFGGGRLDSYYHTKYLSWQDHYKFASNETVYIPSILNAKFAFSRNATYKEIKQDTPSYDFNSIAQSIDNQCIITILAAKANLLNNNGYTQIFLYDKNNNLLYNSKQTNISKYKYKYMSFLFDKSICNIDKVEFRDQYNNILYTTGILELGIENNQKGDDSANNIS